MLTTLPVLLALLMAQTPATPPDDVTVLNARIGPCSAEFTVKDADGSPVYYATIHVRVRYGFWSIKRADLEVGTSSSGKARFDELPDKARPLIFRVEKDGRKAVAEPDVRSACRAAHDITLN